MQEHNGTKLLRLPIDFENMIVEFDATLDDDVELDLYDNNPMRLYLARMEDLAPDPQSRAIAGALKNAWELGGINHVFDALRGSMTFEGNQPS